MPIIPALVRLRQENRGFKASLGYTERPCLKKETKIWEPVAHACNPSYRLRLGDHSFRLVLVVFKTPISKINKAKWTGGVN
jgi:hypothetical protein